MRGRHGNGTRKLRDDLGLLRAIDLLIQLLEIRFRLVRRRDLLGAFEVLLQAVRNVKLAVDEKLPLRILAMGRTQRAAMAIFQLKSRSMIEINMVDAPVPNKRGMIWENMRS